MTDPKKLEIEQLAEARWSRIERGLFDRVAAGEGAPVSRVSERAPHGPRWPMAAALVLAGALAAIGGAAGWRTWGSPRTTSDPSRVATGTTGSHVRVGEATLDIDPESIVSVAGDDAHGIVVHLQRGRVECEVPPRDGRPPFEVEAGDVIVRVVGTHFAVKRTLSDVDVHVDHGVVQVTRGDDRVDVHPGESWSEAARSAPITPSSSAPAVASVPMPAASAPISSAAPTASPSPRDAYEMASRIEANNPDGAIAIYRNLAAKGGPWGMNALYAEGRLEADRGRKDEARRVLADYLSRYPSGPNAGDSRSLLETLQ